jgi:hypothetical protein
MLVQREPLPIAIVRQRRQTCVSPRQCVTLGSSQWNMQRSSSVGSPSIGGYCSEEAVDTLYHDPSRQLPETTDLLPMNAGR